MLLWAWLVPFGDKITCTQGYNMINCSAKLAKYLLFLKFLAKKHCFGNKWRSITFLRTRVSETRVPHQFCHRGTAELEFVRLKKIMWYSSLVNSSSMQHNTWVYQARIPFINKIMFMFISMVLELGELEYLVRNSSLVNLSS